jgi:hypothetical protein
VTPPRDSLTARERDPHEGAQAALVIGDVDLPHGGRAAVVTAAGGRVDVAAGDRAHEARLARDGTRARVGRELVGQRGEDAAVDEAERLLERVGDLDAGPDLVVVTGENLRL